MSLEFVSGALFALGLLLISSWLRDRWPYRVGYRRPPPAVRPANMLPHRRRQAHGSRPALKGPPTSTTRGDSTAAGKQTPPARGGAPRRPGPARPGTFAAPHS